MKVLWSLAAVNTAASMAQRVTFGQDDLTSNDFPLAQKTSR